MGLDENLKQYATAKQWKAMQAIAEHGNTVGAAKALGINRSNVSRSRSALLAKAAQHGYAPKHDMTHPTAPGFKIKGTSTLYDKTTGEAKIQWIKTTADQEQQEAIMRETINAMNEGVPRLPSIPAPSHTDDKLLNLYTFTDYHMGMLAWHKEGGADWDIKIAEKTLIGCFAQMMHGAPNAKTAVICQLGDFLHSDGLIPATPASGHILDADSRYQKIVAVTIRSLHRVVDMALEKHEMVHVIMAEGNHDIASSIWLRAMFERSYENEPRVSVDNTHIPYYAYQHGKTMLGFHHGHIKNNAGLTGLMAAQFPKIWGETTKRYTHCGHRHHVEIKENVGMTIVQHPTLSARDAYASRGGFYSERQALCITYHKEYGQVASNNVTPEMLEQ